MNGWMEPYLAVSSWGQNGLKIAPNTVGPVAGGRPLVHRLGLLHTLTFLIIKYINLLLGE